MVTTNKLCKFGYNVLCDQSVNNCRNKCPLNIMVYEYCPDCYHKKQRVDMLSAPAFCNICGSNLRRYDNITDRNRECNCEEMLDFIG